VTSNDPVTGSGKSRKIVNSQAKIYREGLMSGSVQVITDKEFQTEVLESEKPVLVYFWASWCGPCRLVSPSIDAIAKMYGDRLKVVKMEVDPNQETVKEYKVEGVPALRMFKQNELVLEHEGAITKDKIVQLLEPQL
jgi:thioredoxin 1